MSQASFAARAVGSLKEVVPYAPMFVVGICLYRLWQGTRPRAATALIVAAVLVAYATLLLEQAIALTIAIMAFALILSERAGFLRTRPLIWLGGISYSLYLVHNVAGRAVIVRLEEAGWSADAAIAGAFATTLGAAVLINRGVEVPAQRWLRGVYRRRRFVQPSDFAAGAAAAEVRQN
jgi:peptidoglycan/LPS O-acetylase OafA/YrhL